MESDCMDPDWNFEDDDEEITDPSKQVIKSTVGS